MFGVIIWIIIIYVIVIKVIGQKNDQTTSSNRNVQRSSNSSSYSPSTLSQNTQRSSYYRQDKVDSYRRMNEDHALHDGDEGDLVDTIGYVKCPHCGATVSKKSDTCFMCDKPLN